MNNKNWGEKDPREEKAMEPKKYRREKREINRSKLIIKSKYR